MRAIVWTQYGPPEVLQLRDVATPTPKNDELLIRIRATTVSAGDCELRGLKFSAASRLLLRTIFGFTRPRGKVLGQELAGDVEAVGGGVRRFSKGDQVFGTTGFGFGAYAEYICLPEHARGRAVATKPANMTYEEAATVPTGGLEALYFLRRAGDLSGKRVLINGAGGGIGICAVQLAKYFGAEVTAVDIGGKLDLLHSIGADQVIDYTREDFTKGGEIYDVIFDVVGKSSFHDSMRSLRNDGCYLLANPRPSAKVRRLWTSSRRGRKLILGTSRQGTEDLVHLRQLTEAGYVRAVIDRSYPLKEMVAAHRYFESGSARGRIVITV
jgi:NADPH:quinone reductase-like Zn-dependent oxidoreductase